MSSPGHDQRRPVAGTGVKKVIAANATSMAPLTSRCEGPGSIPAQLRLRRAASYRCPVLDDGRRDPIDKPKASRSITIRAIGRNTVEFAGSDRAVYDAITTLCAKYQRAPRGGAWLVRQDSVEDLMALLEVRGYRLEATL